MDDNDFFKLVRGLELDAYARPALFRSQVLFISLAAYLALFLFLALVVILLLLAWQSAHGLYGQLRIGLGALVVGPLVFVVLRTFLTRLPPPEGREVGREEAPRLFELLDKIQDKLSGPPIHRVVLDDRFNAAISQVPRFGLFGGHRNHLILGLPFLMGVRPSELVAIIGHEYGHVAGNHGKFSAWIYRQRYTFATLERRVAEDAKDNILSGILSRALTAYAPWFNAYTFVAARQHEYEADATASQLAGSKASAAALTRSELLGQWLQQEFWPRLYRQADEAPAPRYLPYQGMRTAIAACEADWATPESLAAAGAAKAELSDTHPSLKERLDAIGEAPALPRPLTKNALDAFFGARAAALVKEFDEAWWQAERNSWQSEYRRHRDGKGRLKQLEASPPESLNPFELHERAVLCAEFGDKREAITLLQRLLARPGGPFPKSEALVGKLLLETGQAAGLSHCQRAGELDPAVRDECARQGYEFLCRSATEEAARTWVESLYPREESE